MQDLKDEISSELYRILDPKIQIGDNANSGSSNHAHSFTYSHVLKLLSGSSDKGLSSLADKLFLLSVTSDFSEKEKDKAKNLIETHIESNDEAFNEILDIVFEKYSGDLDGEISPEMALAFVAGLRYLPLGKALRDFKNYSSELKSEVEK